MILITTGWIVVNPCKQCVKQFVFEAIEVILPWLMSAPIGGIVLEVLVVLVY